MNGKYAMPKDDDSSGVRRFNDFAGEDNSRLRNMFEFFHSWRPQDIAGDKEQFERLLQHHQMKGNVLMEMRRALGPLCYSFALIQIVCRMVGPKVGLPLLGWGEHRRDHPGNPYYFTSEICRNLDSFTSKGKAPTEK